MVRTQIQLEEEQYRRLQQIAREEGISMAELVRRGVDLALLQLERTRRWRRAEALVGRYASGKRDVSRKHDKHLAEIFKK